MPSTMPTLIAAQNECSGCAVIARAARARQGVVQGEVAAADAGRARAAVGLQHVAVDDDLALAEQRHVARGAQRPTDQALDLDRAPALLALAASRSTRSGDEPGSIEYSAVTQPLPLPFIQRGTSSSIVAVHSTRVRPNDTRHDPAAISV